MRILDVSHISSRGSSFRITLPSKIIYGERDGEIVLRKMKMEDSP